MPRRISYLLVLAVVSAAAAQEKKPDPKERPKVTAAWPVAVAPGKATRGTGRGLRLDTATGVRFHEPKTVGRLVKKGVKVGAPDPKLLAWVGDTEAEIEVTVPADADGLLVPFAVENEAGESAPYRLAVDRSPAVAEREPNNG